MPAFDQKDLEARFVAWFEAVRRAWDIQSVVAIALWIALLIAVWGFGFATWPRWAWGLAFGILGLAVLGKVVGMWLTWRVLAPQFGLLCPSCGKSLAGTFGRPTLRQLFGTGKCPNCATVVFAPVTPLSRFRPRRRSPVVRVLVPLLLLAGSVVSGRKLNRDYCRSQYARALTAADTAHADSIELPVSSRRYGTGICGNYRRAGVS